MVYKNKENQKAAASRHYQANKDKMKSRARDNSKISIKRNRDYINNYLLNHPCVDCGNNNVIVLEFDHVKGDKKYELSNLKNSSLSLKTIQNEITKCEIRCANCHRIVTHNRRIQDGYSCINDSRLISLLLTDNKASK